jgi:hypothetical protein
MTFPLAPMGPDVGTLAMRSLAVNLPLVGASVAGAAALYALFTYRSPAAKRRAFLTKLAANRDMPDCAFMPYLEAEDPIEKARRALLDETRDGDVAIRTALRQALASAI